MSCGDIFLGLIAVLFPPIAVWIKSGLCTTDSLLNILLCLLGYLPGLLHAWYIIARNPEYDYYEPVPDAEGGQGRQGRVTYYYVSHEPAQQARAQRAYGTNNNNSRAPKPNASAARPVVAGNQVAGPSTGEGEGPVAPPSYADAVRGDNKVQT